MGVSGYNHSGSITINRPPEDVYAIVADVTSIGELSPVCASAVWDDPAQAGKEGATFTRHNAIGDVTWDTYCTVIASQPGREFTFISRGPAGDVELVQWGYTFEADGDSTKVTEPGQVMPAYPDFVRGGDPDMDVEARIDGMAKMAEGDIKDTRAEPKRVAES